MILNITFILMVKDKNILEINGKRSKMVLHKFENNEILLKN